MISNLLILLRRARLSSVDGNTAITLILRGFRAAVPQHNPPQQPQRFHWQNTAADKGKSGVGSGGTSPTPFRTRAWEQYPELGKTA